MESFFRIAGIRLKKGDIPAFLIGMALPPILLFPVFSYLLYSGVLEHVSYIELLLNGKRKLIYYLAVGLMEEFLFRGLLFGFLCKKINNIPVSVLLAAMIFAILHVINSNAPVCVLLTFSFVFGIFACEMRCFTRSIWMSTAFHWMWNYSVVSVFMKTNTIQFIYWWITIEIIILALTLYWLLKL